MLANDCDSDGGPLTAALVGGPTHGTLTLEPDWLVRSTSPATGSSGTDSFTYKANDGRR